VDEPGSRVHGHRNGRGPESLGAALEP